MEGRPAGRPYEDTARESGRPWPTNGQPHLGENPEKINDHDNIIH
jgi:hypothetical protein